MLFVRPEKDIVKQGYWMGCLFSSQKQFQLFHYYYYMQIQIVFFIIFHLIFLIMLSHIKV